MSATGGAPLRFHWRPLLPIRPPELERWLAVCRSAERYGVESVVVALDATAPDPFAWAAALGRRTAAVAFLVVIRSGVSSPTYAVQQINTLAAVTGARVRVGVSSTRPAGQHRQYGDLLDPTAHVRRTDEFLSVCHELWRGAGPVDFAGRYYTIEGARLTTPWVAAERSRPEIYLFAGAAPPDPVLARHADCVIVTGSPAEVRDRGAAAPDTKLGVAAELPRAGDPRPDGRMAEEVAAYRAVGVGQFVLTGAPEQLTVLGREVLGAPAVAAKEGERA